MHFSTAVSQNVDIRRNSWANRSLKITIALRKKEPTGHRGKLGLTKLKQTGKNAEKLKSHVIRLGINLNHYHTALKRTPNVTDHRKAETGILIVK